MALPCSWVSCSAGGLASNNLKSSREQWAGWKLDDYRFVLDADCLCPLVPVIIEVRDGKPSSVAPAGKDVPAYFNPAAAEERA